MKEETSVSNTNQDTSGVEDSQKKEKDFVSYDTHAKLLKQRKSDQEAMRNLEARLAEFEQQQKQREEQTLVEQENWKKLADNYKKEAETAKSELGNMKGGVEKMIKKNAFLDKLPGKIKHPDYLEFIPVDNILLDPTTGNVEENSLSQTVEEWMQTHGKHLVEIPGEKKRMPSAPTGTTTQTNNKADVAQTLREMLTKRNNQ